MLSYLKVIDIQKTSWVQKENLSSKRVLRSNLKNIELIDLLWGGKIHLNFFIQTSTNYDTNVSNFLVNCGPILKMSGKMKTFIDLYSGFSNEAISLKFDQ